MIKDLLKIYREEIHNVCPALTEEEVIEAGTSLLQIVKLLSEAAQENPELEVLINAQMEGDFINEHK
mgnify:CR=1 FL=1